MKHAIRALILTFLCLTAASSAQAQAQQALVVRAERASTATALRDAVRNATAPVGKAPFAVPNKFKMGAGGFSQDQADGFNDPVRQSAQGPMNATSLVSFEGSNDDDNAAILGYRLVPPDTQGDVGPNHYVQWINSISEIFDKNGNTILGPFAGNAYFSDLGSGCGTDNDGDPVVLYDEQADRWLVSQFAVTSGNYICVAISQTPDPTGAYNQYQFDFGTDFPDYPKLGIWGDSYVMTTRDFSNGQFWGGISAVALDRSAMLNGQAATMVRFDNAFGFNTDGYLPADADGAVSGPAVFGGHGDDGDTTFELWELDVDWNNPGGATFTSIGGGGISPYDGVVPPIDQPVTETLADLSFFTMHRMNVRDFGTHRSMVANHTVETSPGTAGIRWYEFRDTGSGWFLYQEGTFSPDSEDRWMGSIAMNASGDIALGYSLSSNTTFPSIYVTGQTADQSGTGLMNVAETQIHAGSGAQIGQYDRWGDYSKMSVDPSDGQTFWYTTEYYASSASFDFKTRIAAFSLESGPFNNPPVVTITDPADGAQFAEDSSVSFSGVASDAEDGDISSSISWSSSLDGPLGSGASVSASLSNGDHVITAEVTDSGDPTSNPKSDSDQISVSVVPASAFAMHVHNDVVVGNAGSGRDKFGTATVTIYDGQESPVSGATVTVQFSGDFSESIPGVTDGSGVVTVQTENPARNPLRFDACVESVSHASLPYDSTQNENPTSDCDGGGEPPPPPPGGESVHVASVSTGSQGVGKGEKIGTATVTIVDNNGNNPGAGYMVTGDFSGDIIDHGASAETNDQGVANLQTSGTARGGVSVSFCVSNVSGTLPWMSSDDAPGTNCSSFAAGKSGQTATEGDVQPDRFALAQNYPNPFNPSTIISWSQPESGAASLRVFNVMGQEVAVLANGRVESGVHRVTFDASDLTAGVYVYVLQTADGQTATKRMTLLK
ncbi:MAG: T9SS type A sorting domain-containing protein [Rhodothermales bacterium]|nr:T9SS type A sorting domain-containing protein [Rhodothermales bacterium]